VSTLFYSFKKPEIGQLQKPSTICLIVSDLISRSQVSLKKEEQRAVLSLALPSNSPPLYAIIHFLIRPIQLVQRIIEVFIRPGTHHQNPLDLTAPGWGSMPGLGKKGNVLASSSLCAIMKREEILIFCRKSSQDNTK
jgi:hypothetical protein